MIKVQVNSLRSKIEEYINQKYSMMEISKLLEIPYYSLYSNIKEWGLKTIKNGTSRKSKKGHESRTVQFDKQELYNLYYVQMLNTTEIAKILKCGHVTVFNAMKDFGFTLRSKSESAKLIWTEEKREKQRKLANDGIIGVHFHGCNAYKNSSIERCFQNWCKENNIDFQCQFQISKGGHKYDFLLKENILVEVDGLYWHNTPKQQEKDKKFESEALNAGFQIIRFTDKEIEKTKGECFERLFKFYN